MLAIDPGLRGLGVAVFVDQELADARYVPSFEHGARGPAAWVAMAKAFETNPWDVVVIEVPQIYQGAKQKGDPDDLLQVTGVVGAICGRVRADRLVGVRPREWKGQLPKEVCRARIEGKLSEVELRRVVPSRHKSLAHNVWDAVGIGLFFLELERGSK